MLIINVNTNEPFRVIRKFEEKPARLVAITCPESGKYYRLVYTLEESQY